MADDGPPNTVAAMDPRRKDREGEPSDVRPHLIYRLPADGNGRQADDPPRAGTESRLRIDMVIRAVRERRSPGS